MSLTNAYGAKIIKGYSLTDIKLAIEKASLVDKCHEATNVVRYITEAQDVPPFPYPIYDVEKDLVFVDSRPYTGLERTGNLKIRNSLDEKLNLLLAQLEVSWVKNDRPDAAQRAFGFSSEVLVRWLSNTISHKYGLSLQQKSQLTALTAMFSVGQFYNNVENDLTVERHLQSISRNYPVHLDVVKETAVRVENFFPRDVDEFVQAIEKLDLGPRLRGFNTKGLYTILNGSWWSNANTPTLVAIAVEYPPVMAALVSMAIENSMFKRTQIGGIVDTLNRGSNHDNHRRGIDLFIDQHCSE